MPHQTDQLTRITELLDLPAQHPGSMRYFRGAPVGASEDLERIKALPRRVINVEDKTAAEIWTRLLRRERSTPCNCTAPISEGGFGEACITSLRPVQGWALQEAFENEGMVGSIGVGKGKTGIDILLPMVVPNCKVAAVFIPSSLREQFLFDWKRWAAHFKVPNLVGVGTGGDHNKDRPIVYVVPYSTLSQIQSSDLLPRINADLLIGDEAQSLKNPDAARTDRFIRVFRRFDPVTKERIPAPRYCCHSGTFTTKTPDDFAHHVGLALRGGSPLPISKQVLAEFSSALAELPQGNAHPGKLLELALPGEVEELRKSFGDDDTLIARLVFARRFRETPGVVVTIDGKPRLGEGPREGEPIALELNQRKLMMPQNPINVTSLQPRLRGLKLEEILADVRATWERPDGEELVEVIEFVACVRQLASGLFYKWRFPRKESPDVIDTWFAKRKAWGKDLRTFLANPQPFGDSKYWATQAAIRWHFGYEFEGKRIEKHTKRGPLPVFPSEAFIPWLEVEATVEPAPATVWLDSFLVNDAVEWLREHPKKGIVWYEHTALGEEISRKAREAGLTAPLYTGGDRASAEIRREDGSRSIIASIKAHGTGKNLQRFTHGLIVNPMGDGAGWEQTLGRWHRDGQTAERVWCDVYRHTGEYQDSIDNAIGKAKYIQSMMGSEQRLCYAEIGWKWKP